VVERHIREPFIPNDLEFTPGGIIKVITGPNMAGKSTYIRTVAVLQIMAQCGSFVPADLFDTNVADRVYARIGASDNIARGESTFLVEMSETAAILNTATDRSLIIMDEVGRGTSTYDGLSIAQAIIEYIVSSVKGRTLFATHYHELTALESPPAIENLTVAVQERAGGVEFLHRVIKGPADKSYGIHVASLAGIPREVTARAKKHLERFEKKSSKVTGAKAPEASDALELFNASNHIVLKTLSALDPDRMTPIEALAELSRLKRLVD
jgi:DNA mismatch repair protein MutS